MRGSAQSDECRVLLPLILATQVRFLHWLQSVVPLRKEFANKYKMTNSFIQHRGLLILEHSQVAEWLDA